MARRRRPGKREPNGRPQRAPAAETEWQTKEHVLRLRCRALGWRPTVDNLRTVDRFGGTPWGMALLHGRLGGSWTQTAPMRRFLAADELAALRHAYVRAKGLPREHAPCGPYGDATGGATHSELSPGQKAAIALYEALRGAEREAVFLALDWIRGARPHHADLFEALDRLANYFRIEA